MISAGYGSPALLLHGLPQGNPARAAILLVLARAAGTRAALENPERVAAAAAAAAAGAILKDGLTMDGTAVLLENLERAVHLVRDGVLTHLGLLARVASLALKDGTLEDTGGVERVERDPSPRDPSRKDRRQRDRRPREAREDGTTAALAGAAAATLAGVLESLESLVDPLVIGLPIQVIGLTMVGAVLPESRVRVAAVEVETRGLTLHTTHGMALASQARDQAEVETHGATVALMTGPTVATQERVGRDQAEVETHGATVALMTGPTVATQERVGKDQAEVEIHGATVALMTGPTVATLASQARDQAEVETHGPMVALMTGPTVATLQERVERGQAEVETHGATVALMTGPTVATLQERVGRDQAGLLVSLQESQERHHLMKDGLLAVMIGRLLPTLQERVGRQVLVLTAMKPAIQQQRPCHLTRNIQIAERLDGY